MKTILLAEDDTDLRIALAEILKMEGYKVLEAASGNEAIDLLKGGSVVDLVISDYLMQRGSGLDLLRFLRAHRPENVPFILMTGQSEVGKRESLALGAQEFVLKPFDVPDFLEMIHLWCQTPLEDGAH